MAGAITRVQHIGPPARAADAWHVVARGSDPIQPAPPTDRSPFADVSWQNRTGGKLGMSEGGRWAAAAVLLGTLAPAATSLPPEVSFVDNLVADPSFEGSFFAPNWEGAGLTRTTAPNVRSGAGAAKLAAGGATAEADVSQTIVFAPAADGAYPTEVRVRGWAQPLGITGCDPAGCAGFGLAANAVVLGSGGSTRHTPPGCTLLSRAAAPSP